MPTLLDISADFVALDELLEEIGGDMSDPRVAETIDRWFSDLQDNLKCKSDNYAAFIGELEARAAVRKDEAKRLHDKSAADARKADWLKNRLRMALEQIGVKKVEGDRYTITVATNGGKTPLAIDDPTTIPRELCSHVPEEWVPDGDAIREALATGREVPGVRLLERGTHLRIR